MQTPYPDVLATPIEIERNGNDDEASLAAQATRIAAQRHAKLALLAQALDVPEGDWYALAMALAVAHVPGLGVISPASGPHEWCEFDKAELRLDVEQVQKKTGKSMEASISEVVRAEHWRTRARRATAAALRTHYLQAKEEWIRFCKEVRRASAAGTSAPVTAGDTPARLSAVAPASAPRARRPSASR